MILFHGTDEKSAKKIMEFGFKQHKTNWHDFPSMDSFTYLSDVYALYYAHTKDSDEDNLRKTAALIKVEVPDSQLYPDEDFVGAALKLNISSSKEKWDEAKTLATENPDWWKDSYNHMGLVCAKHESIKILGVRYFNASKLIFVYDPVPSLMNFKYMGDEYRQMHYDIYDGIPIKSIIEKQQERLKTMRVEMGIKLPVDVVSVNFKKD